MKTLVKWIFYLIVAVAVIVIAGSFLLPARAVVTRSIDIAAPPEKVFAIVGDLHHLPDYSPWADLDPNMTMQFDKPEVGVGQTMRWSSTNSQVGSGTQTIIEYEPSTHVASTVAFGTMGTSRATWDLELTTTGGTKATWGLTSELDGIPAKWFGLMFDRWIGADYEKGLARLKIAAEKPAT